jgi:HPt (histidine-containing phosphotransfer) domain-containing protein
MGVFCYREFSDVTLRHRLTALDTHLDDLESGVDAGSRAAGHIRKTAASIVQLQLEPIASAGLVRTLARYAKELQDCVRDQRAAFEELRAAIARLRDELTGSNQAVRPPPANAAAGQRR